MRSLCRALSRSLLVLAVAGVAFGFGAADAWAEVVQRNGRLEIDGRVLTCGKARTVIDRRLPGEGAASPGVLYFNPRYLERLPEAARLFVFHHECGHQRVGGDELAADCHAVGQGVREGWLDRRGLGEVCQTFAGMPETSTHPSGKRRCRNLEQCFATAAASEGPADTGTSATRASSAAFRVEAQSVIPKLLSAPRQVVR